MNKYELYSSQYEQISSKEFWAAVMNRIAEHRAVLSRMCEKEDDPRRPQGGIEAIDFILGRNEQPNIAVRLLEETRKKKS
jgi:hypothetical protein